MLNLLYYMCPYLSTRHRSLKLLLKNLPYINPAAHLEPFRDLTQLPVQLCFGNGRLEEFLLDQTVTAVQMQTPPIAVCVAAAMAMFNFTQLTKLPRSERSQPICWGRLRSWAGSMQKLYSKEELAAEHIDNADALVSLCCL